MSKLLFGFGLSFDTRMKLFESESAQASTTGTPQADHYRPPTLQPPSMSDLQALARASRSGIYNLIAKGKLPSPDVVFVCALRAGRRAASLTLDALATPAV